MDQRQRVSAFLDELRTKPYRRVAIFAHGGVLACVAIYSGLYAMEAAWDNLTPTSVRICPPVIRK